MYAKMFKTEKCLNLDENLHNTNEVNLQFISLNLLYENKMPVNLFRKEN